MGKRISVPEATSLLRISHSTLYTLIKRGILTKYVSQIGTGHGGRRTYLDLDEVKRLARDKERGVKDDS